MVKSMAFLMGFMLLVGAASAHQVWLERGDEGQARAYFGEWAKGVIETADGHLGSITSPVAYLRDASQPLPIEQQQDHFAIEVASSGDVRFVENGLKPYGKAGERVKYVFLAKVGRSETQPAAPLELVPVEAGSDTFTLIYEGEPVAGAEVNVVNAQKWQKAFHTDDAGRVTLELAEPGQYLIETSHEIEQTGGEGDTAYIKLHYISTLTVVVK